MIKAIIFDYGGVLSNKRSLRSFMEINASKYKTNPWEFNELLIDNWHKARIDKINSKLFWKNLADFLKTDKKTLRKDFMNYLGFRHEVLDLIKKLKRSYKLGLLSNQIEDWLEEVIENHKLNQIFDVIVTSYNSKVAKPDIAIYKKIVNELGVKPNECVFIDDMEKNIPSAKEIGMQTIHFKDYPQLLDELKNLGVNI